MTEYKYMYHSRFNQKQKEALAKAVKKLGYNSFNDYLSFLFNKLLKPRQKEIKIELETPLAVQKEVADLLVETNFKQLDIESNYIVMLNAKFEVPYGFKAYLNLMNQYFFTLDKYFDYCLMMLVNREYVYQVPFPAEQMSELRHAVSLCRTIKLRAKMRQDMINEMHNDVNNKAND